MVFSGDFLLQQMIIQWTLHKISVICQQQRYYTDWISLYFSFLNGVNIH